MKVFMTVICFTLLGFAAFSQQNVGIGTPQPQMPLHVSKLTDSALILLENQSPLNTNTNAGLYFKNGNYYTGAIKTIGTGSNTARLSFFSFANGISQNNLKEGLTLLDNGAVGIGNINPQYNLDVTGNLHTSTNVLIDGTIKIAGGTPGVGKVLTSDADGNASWQRQAYGNTERFLFHKLLNLINYSIDYNLGTAIINSGTGEVTIGKTGLYHLEARITASTSNDYSQNGNSPRTANLMLYVNGNDYFSLQQGAPFVKTRVYGLLGYTDGYSAATFGSTEIYLTAGSVISTRIEVPDVSIVEFDLTRYFLGNLIAE